MVVSLIYNLCDDEKWYWMRWSWVQYHFSESRKLYIGWANIQHLLISIILSIQFEIINEHLIPKMYMFVGLVQICASH